MRDSTLFSTRLLAWYDVHQRRLPWRLPAGSDAEVRLDPYHVLVSEAMLQQTQVATVVPYFERFIARFPTAVDLASADLHDVLHAWQGLGYYSRARNLQRAAKEVVERFGGCVPSTVEKLLTLPGVGRYTAGAVASIAFGTRAPILDGNVVRVLCRLDAIEDDPRLPTVRERLWERAEEILPASRLADFNSALMELGATVCTPRAPKCLMCPVRPNCEAAELGMQDSIPPKKPAMKASLHVRWVLCVEHSGKFLIERRPPAGRWAGLWQFVTVTPEKRVSVQDVVSTLFPSFVEGPRKLGRVLHALTHRRYRFDAYHVVADAGAASDDRRWVSLAEMDGFAMSVPQQKVRALLEARLVTRRSSF